MKILIVDDSEANRRLLRDVLLYYGHEVVDAGNGAEGVKLAKEHLPDLILMDIQMPVLNGFAALRILKEASETNMIKVIAMTSFAMNGDEEKVMAEGFDGYISKPMDIRELPGLLKKMTEG